MYGNKFTGEGYNMNLRYTTIEKVIKIDSNFYYELLAMKIELFYVLKLIKTRIEDEETD